MTDAIAEFFDRLAGGGHDPRLEKATGTLRFDLEDGEATIHWFVTIDRGDIAVSHRNVKADCIVRMSRGLFDRLVKGETNLVAAVLRGVMGVEGDLGLVTQFQRLFPGPPSRARTAKVGAGRREP